MSILSLFQLWITWQFWVDRFPASDWSRVLGCCSVVRFSVVVDRLSILGGSLYWNIYQFWAVRDFLGQLFCWVIISFDWFSGLDLLYILGSLSDFVCSTCVGFRRCGNSGLFFIFGLFVTLKLFDSFGLFISCVQCIGFGLCESFGLFSYFGLFTGLGLLTVFR